MTKVRVLRAFAYSHDGLSVRVLGEGDEVDVRDDLFAGLLAGGFVRPLGAGIHIGVGAETPKDGPHEESAMIEAPENKAIEPPETKSMPDFAAMDRAALIEFLNAHGVGYFRGAADDALRATARQAASAFATNRIKA